MTTSLPDPYNRAAANLCSGGLSERTERHLRMLAELAEIGMELARKVGQQALQEAGAASGEAGPVGERLVGDPGLVFSRIARAVRQTLALEARLEADARAIELQKSAAQTSREAAQRARVRQQKTRLKRLVEDAISGEADPGDAENLRIDLEERLEDPDIDAELGWRPIGVMFAAICQDLGIDADLRHFTDAELGFDIKPKRMGVAAEAPARAGGAPGVEDREKPGPDGGGHFANCDDNPGDAGNTEEAAALALRLALSTKPPD